MIEQLRSGVEQHPVGTAAIVTGTVAGSAALLYRRLQPEKSKDSGDNYFDIIGNLDTCITEGTEGDVQYLMLGGGAAAALRDEGTVIDLENRTITPPADIRKNQYRSDNGTMADVDILVISDDDDVIESVRSALKPDDSIIYGGNYGDRDYELDKPGARLKIGVTGLMPESEYHEEPDSLFGSVKKLVMKDWVSQRVQYQNGTRTVAIADREIELPEEYFQPWKMVLKNGEAISVPHPLVQVLCYLSRASHGIRERDIEKVEEMMENIGPTFGARLEWGDKKETARLVLADSADEEVQAAAEFCDEKNELRWKHTKERIGRKQAGLLAAKIAIHRKLDKWEFIREFGQDGWLYDNIIARFSGERQ